MLEWAWTKCARVRVFSATAHSAPVHPGAWSHGWVVPEEQSRGTAGMPRMRELGSGGAAGQSLGVLHQTLLLMASAGTLRPPPRCHLPTARSTPGCTQSRAPGTWHRPEILPLSPTARARSPPFQPDDFNGERKGESQSFHCGRGSNVLLSLCPSFTAGKAAAEVLGPAQSHATSSALLRPRALPRALEVLGIRLHPQPGETSPLPQGSIRLMAAGTPLKCCEDPEAAGNASCEARCHLLLLPHFAPRSLPPSLPAQQPGSHPGTCPHRLPRASTT